ncbi:MAG: DNA polymerase III subunit alpha [Salinivirgaceae bacterium]|jgi:DNA polymerase-3 subunit alpha|nr:DNA polymerase III subunit alpha [Salinivirgaceae bacterium]
MFLVFDTETTGLPKKWKAPLTDFENWPRLVQLAWQCHDLKGNLLFAKNHVITPDGYTIPDDVVAVHGITTEIAHEQGIPLKDALSDFIEDVKKTKFIIGHNIEFDVNIVGCELLRSEMPEIVSKAPQLCTKIESTEFCAIMKNGKAKWPTLTELHTKLFGHVFEEAHNAAADVEATTRCFLELVRVGAITARRLEMNTAEIEAFKTNNPKVIQPAGIRYESFKVDIFTEIDIREEERKMQEAAKSSGKHPFVHLHVHSQYSILDGAAKTSQIAEKAKSDGMTAVALTDHGGMFGCKEFHVSCNKAGIKPIIGVEAYVAVRGHLVKENKSDGRGNHLVLLAKNKIGYRNLLKLTSIAHIDGMYYKPRIDKELLEQYKEGLIVSSACLGGEISQHIMNGNIKKAEETILWFKEVFGDDYYLELQRHRTNDPRLRTDVWENQIRVNCTLINLAKKLDVKIIATNDSHFIDEDDAEAHDLLVCLSTGRDFDDQTRMRYTRQEWFKTTAEMNLLFADVPEALLNTEALAEKIEAYELNSDPIMPEFTIPADFGTITDYKEKYSEEQLIEEFTQKAFNRLGGYNSVLQVKLESNYLEYLTYQGAKERFGDPLDASVVERIDFELDTIKTMGFPGYFLITQDFINAAKNNGVLVGPGRGSAAGSVVAYSVGITNVDPIKYDLLFERFLNPDRVSMPDVDIDFDDDGRQWVLDWVTEKYGRDKVAHICTFGTMATKSSIKDVSRVLKLPLDEANRLAKMVPEAPGMTFKKAYKESQELCLERDESPNELLKKTLLNAEKLEGSVRQTGVHACGILIGRDPLDEHVPIMPTKEKIPGKVGLMVTQYDGRFVEDIGLLKMDFLGLKTLSIIKECLANIKLSKGHDIDIDKISFEDEKAYQLFANGETTAIFQFESPGMKKHLQNLKPDRFDDLVAMNALYRPGPMEYIPSFIERKHGRERVEYDNPLMEPYLKDTYGITVYQEQVMLQSRALGGFTRGDSDTLRKAMGKKIIAMMDKLKVKFVDGCANNPEFVKGAEDAKKKPEEVVEKIWKDWEAFAAYAFNKSHSVCYAYIAYQTGYLKAHFPAEFMSANLSRNLSNMEEVTKLMSECKRMGLKVYGPDVNMSYKKFTVDKAGDIRFGMAAIKNVGEGAVENIIEERETNGPYKDVWDFVERVDLRAVNRRAAESLAQAGGFDGFDEVEFRSQFFEKNENNETFIDSLLKYGNLIKSDKEQNQTSLFANIADEVEVARPKLLSCEPWSNLEQLNREKELVGIYLSAHPLDTFRLEIDNFCNTTLSEFSDMASIEGKEVTLGAIVTGVRSAMTKTGKPFGGFTLEDDTGTYETVFFGKDYLQFKNYCTEGYSLYLKGKIQKGWRGDELEFKISSIEMLVDVREKLIKGVTMKISVNDITQKFINDLLAKAEENKGNALLKFIIFDPKQNEDGKTTWMQMFSRTHTVDINNDLLNFIESQPGVEYKLE